jgi:crossover junction endodeoxyribonuclease RuvC
LEGGVNQIICGCDPGTAGAVCFMRPTGELESVHDLPVQRDKSLAWIDGSQLTSILLDGAQGRTIRAIVERVGSMPGQGVASCFTFGMMFGSLLAVLQARHASIELVSPAVWKKALALDKDKKASLHRARMLYPDADLSLEKHHNRAEAILLARWAISGAHLSYSSREPQQHER